MTLLVGLVGNDGIVLAADKCLIEFAEKENDCNDVVGGRKIFQLEGHKAVYAYVGDWATLLVGRELTLCLDDGRFNYRDIRTSLEEIAAKGFRDAVNFVPQRPFSADIRRQILAVFYGAEVSEPQLWGVTIGRIPSAAQVDGISIAGAMGNTARFFAHYFEYNRPVANLTRLAAHVVLMGHKDGFIDGLDVVTVCGGTLQWYTEDEKEPLRKLSEGLDTNLRKQFYS